MTRQSLHRAQCWQQTNPPDHAEDLSIKVKEAGCPMDRNQFVQPDASLSPLPASG
ncbi:MAG: hypothetical protein M3R45_10820 [Pseudomonadota bacterium]|nr:hypothetical protein [Pseudomonadota bacterium]